MTTNRAYIAFLCEHENNDAAVRVFEDYMRRKRVGRVAFMGSHV